MAPMDSLSTSKATMETSNSKAFTPSTAVSKVTTNTAKLATEMYTARARARARASLARATVIETLRPRELG